MYQGKRLRAFAVIPFVAIGLAAQAPDATTPAGQEAVPVKVAPHSSRWDYPREVTPGPGQQIHVVQKGDTLWDLGTRYLGNPFAWPQIWELNKWVKDPHWIYPGDPILVEASRSTVGRNEGAPRDVVDLKPDLRRIHKPSLDEYAYSFQDFIQMPYLVPGSGEAYLKQAGAFRIIGQEDVTRALLMDGDVLYLGGGSDQGVKAGDRLVITKVVVPKFYHPDDKHHSKPLGAVLEQFGILRITHVYPSRSVAIIEKSMDGVSSDGFAMPFTEPVAILNALRTDIGSPIEVKEPTPRVIFIRMAKSVAGSGDLVLVDRGSEDGFKVGEVLLTARPMKLDAASKDTSPDNMTNYYLGQLMVIRTGEHTATCRILRSKSEVMVGDLLTR